MGNSKTKDERVDIYFEIDRPYYHSGDWVDGNVYIVAKQNLAYKALYLRLQGREHCHWHEKYGKTDVWYTGDRTTYQNEFILAKWPNGMPMGHYTFPFRFQIPPDAPGSYLENKDENFTILYPLQAYLIDYNDDKKKPDYTYNIAVVEPPRTAQIDLVLNSTANPKVCCCSDQGTTTMSLKFRNTAVKGGTPIQVDAYIDNTRCRQPIQAVELSLNNHLFVDDDSGNHRNWGSTKIEMKSRSVPAGGTDTIQLEMLAAVPSSTAIGSIVANYYMLKIRSKVGGCICCCGSNHPEIEKHIFIEACNPESQEKKVMNPPPGWNPIVAPKVVYSGSANFNYQKNPNLEIMNRVFP